MPRKSTSPVWPIDVNDTLRPDDQAITQTPTTPGSGSNWLWLAELAQWTTTLELDLERPRLGSVLQRHFAEVRFHAISAGPGLPFSSAHFDCVTLNGVIERLLPDRRRSAATLLPPLFRECRRVLRPGGCLFVGTGSMETPRRLSRWQALLGARRPLVVDRLLRAAGFTTVHAYLVEPCLDRPYAIIPATRRSLAARERALANGAGPNLRRMLAVRLGLAHALYPARIGLAYA